ncbi:mechanosensitive ion channel [bacterium]|nr:mechanosensitive ion channel [bacterium]
MDLFERLGQESDLFRMRLITFGGTDITPEKIIVFAVILAVAYIFSRLLQRAMAKAFAMRGIRDQGTVDVAKRLLHYVILAIALGVAIETIGVNLTALFAAGAIFAIGLGFAMQNIVQNFVSGVILLAERTIKPGDVLQVDGRFVKVQHMGIRSTICRTLDEEELIVPNSEIVQSAVTNYTLKDSLYRLRCTVGVVYGSDMALVKKTLQEIAGKLSWRYKEKQPVVYLAEFGDSSVVWEVSVWISDPWIMRRARSDLNEAIWWALKERGIVIAFPQLDLHLDAEVVDSMRKRTPRD